MLRPCFASNRIPQCDSWILVQSKRHGWRGLQAEQDHEGGEAKACGNRDCTQADLIEQQTEYRRGKSLSGARRRPNESIAFAVGVRPEYCERNRASGNCQKPIAGAVKNRKRHDARRTHESQSGCSDRMQRRGKSRGDKRVDVAKHYKFEQPRGHLGGTHEGTSRDGCEWRGPSQFEQCWQVSRH